MAHFAKTALALSFSLTLGEEHVDAGWELLATSAGPEVPRTCTPTKNIPPWAHGSFFIAGPALFEMGGISFKSLFDGYGRTNRFEMSATELCYTSAFLNTSYYQAAVRLGKIGPGVLFEGTVPDRPPCPTLDPVCDLQAPRDNNWVNLLPVQGKALLLSDSTLMLSFDPETLAVSGEHQWEDSLDWAFHRSTFGSAHPVLRPGTEATYIEVTGMVPIVPFTSPYIAVYAVDAAVGRTRTLLARVPTKNLQYFHSFGVTEHYVVLPCNMKMSLSGAVATHRTTIVETIQDGWDGIHVADLAGNVHVFDTEKFFHVHISNTFENATGIVMDLGAYDQLPFSADSPALTTAKFLNKTVRDARSGVAEFRRYHLHTAGPLKGTATAEVLSERGRQLDFFRINPAFIGRPYCFSYMSEWFHDDKAYASMAILKLDLCTGAKTYWSRNNTYPHEPNFISKGGDDSREDDGVVVFAALDGVQRTSMFVVLDGTTFQELVVVPLPVHIPFLGHGQFIPTRGQAAQSAVAVGEEAAAANAGVGQFVRDAGQAALSAVAGGKELAAAVADAVNTVHV
mmetsp:Transcript_43858/g.121358  ORF Transcript_43858/g.121358 Transcript_43858/m.121358 type:complete len:567 (-) Transcript_43858:167-1867(-)